MKTVREVAFDLGVSKTRILKIINNLPKRKKPKFVGNKYLLNDENIFDISCFITNIESKRNDNLDTDFDNLVIENQQQVIEILKEQNKNKDLQIEQLQKDKLKILAPASVNFIIGQLSAIFNCQTKC